VLFIRYRQSHLLHVRCVKLCHRIAAELSYSQEQEQVIDRVFEVVIDQTKASIGLLLFNNEAGRGLRVLRTHGLSDEEIAPGDYLEPEDKGYGFGQLKISGGAELHHQGLATAVQTSTRIKLHPRQNMMCIPVVSQGQTHGLLQLISSPERAYTKPYLNDLGGLGIYLAAAIHNAKKLETIRHQRDAAETLYKIGLTISRFLDLDEILSHAVDETQKVMGSDFTWYMDKPKQQEMRGIVRNLAGDLKGQFDIGTQIELSGRSVELLKMESRNTKEAYILVWNLRENSGEGPLGHPPPSSGEHFCNPQMSDHLLKLGVRSAILVPVGLGDQNRGLLCSFSHRADFYDSFHVRLQQRIANQVLIALQSADSHRNAQRLALVEERQRMSNDLHDNMSQVINGLSLELHSLTKIAGRNADNEPILNRLEIIRGQLDEAKAKIREAIFELQIPDGSGLWENLRDFTGRFEQWHNFRVNLDLPVEKLTLTISQQREVLRIVQESLWNVRVHSGTSEASLSGHYHPGENIQIQVSDKGRKLTEPDFESGQGIAIMKNRIERLQGTLAINPGKPSGVLVSIEFPYHAH
jgi:signal transduction histidine kinase